jgi:ABC-2 type transporter
MRSVKRLTGFAMVTVWPGRLVILDEPTNDVDPLRRRLLWDQIRALGESGYAVLLVTHNVMEAEKSVDRLAIIADGRLIAEGTPSSLKADDRDHLRLQVMLAPRAAALLFVPAVLLCALMAVCVGFAMALAIPNPMVVNLITNALVFVVLLFTPIVFPPTFVPDWLFHLQQALPFYNMAVVIRAGLTVGMVDHVATSFLVLTGWTVAGIAGTAWVIGRRR